MARTIGVGIDLIVIVVVIIVGVEATAAATPPAILIAIPISITAIATVIAAVIVAVVGRAAVAVGAYPASSCVVVAVIPTLPSSSVVDEGDPVVVVVVPVGNMSPVVVSA